MVGSDYVNGIESQGIPRRFKRFPVSVPVAVLTSPSPPHWIPLRFQGQSIEVGRGGMSVKFAHPVASFLYRAKSVRLQIGTAQSIAAQHTINARVAWVRDDCVGFEFIKILRDEETPLIPPHSLRSRPYN